jgi:hypothetical protein
MKASNLRFLSIGPSAYDRSLGSQEGVGGTPRRRVFTFVAGK